MRERGCGSAARAADGNPLQMSLWSAREASPDWHVRISRRARRLSMRVFPGGRVEVVVPPGVGIPAIERFVARHRDWAERRSREFALLVPHGHSRRAEAVELVRNACDGRPYSGCAERCPVDEIYKRGIRCYELLLDVIEKPEVTRKVAEFTKKSEETIKNTALKIVHLLLSNRGNDLFCLLACRMMQKKVILRKGGRGYLCFTALTGRLT